jgi:hypothetical protein
MDNNIENIILNKTYKELNSDERVLISEYISSPEEYNEIKITLAKILSVKEEELIPEASVKNNLLKKFHPATQLQLVSGSGQNNSKSRIMNPWFAYAALIVAGLFIAFLIFRNSGKQEPSIAEKEIIPEKVIQPDHHQTLSDDSVNPVQENKTKNENNLAQIVNKQANITPADTSKEIMLAQNNSQILNNTTKKGRTLKDDLALADLMYVAL